MEEMSTERESIGLKEARKLVTSCVSCEGVIQGR
jgi:hypothetical protein